MSSRNGNGATTPTERGVKMDNIPPPTTTTNETGFPTKASDQDTYTISQAINSFGFGGFQVRLSFLTGLCWMSDAMEMIILSLLGPILKCAWNISNNQEAMMTSVVFIGMALSSCFWGSFCDKYGRKTGLVLSSCLVFYFGLITSVAPTFGWMLTLRAIAGFSLACLPQSVTLYSEFLPVKARGKAIVMLAFSWALGACFEVILALLVMPSLGWRWLLALSALPVFIFLLSCFWLPESIRYIASLGQTERANNLLMQMSVANKMPMPSGKLVLDDVGQGGGRGQIHMLFSADYRLTTILLWMIWFAAAFCYYGAILFGTELINALGTHGNICDLKAQSSISCLASCKPPDEAEYLSILYTTFAEFPGIILLLLTVELMGRKRSLALLFSIFGLSLLFLLSCPRSSILLNVILFTGRAAVTGAFQAAYVYTPEVYPTSLRSIGMGTCSGLARLGAILTPFVAQVLLHESLIWTIFVYFGVALLAGIASLSLPLETKGREMLEMRHKEF